MYSIWQYFQRFCSFLKSIFFSEDNRYFFNQDTTVETVLFYHIESIVDNIVINCWSGPELDVCKNHQKCQFHHLLMPLQNSMIFFHGTYNFLILKVTFFYTFHTHVFMMYNLLKSMLNDCNDKWERNTIKWVHMALILYFESHGRFVWRQWHFFSSICHHPLGLNDAECHLLLYPIHFHCMEKSRVSILPNIYSFWNNTRISKWWQDFILGGKLSL